MPNPRRIPRSEDFDLEVEVEAATSRLTELVSKTMDEQGISRAELARRLGVTPPHVTQFLRGERNITLRTVVEALFKMNKRLDIVVIPRDVSENLHEDAPILVEFKTSDAPRSSAEFRRHLAQVSQYAALSQGHLQGSHESTETSVRRSAASPGSRERQPQFVNVERWLQDAMRDEIADAQHPGVQYGSNVIEAPTDELDRSIQSWVDGERNVVTDHEIKPVLVG